MFRRKKIWLIIVISLLILTGIFFLGTKKGRDLLNYKADVQTEVTERSVRLSNIDNWTPPKVSDPDYNEQVQLLSYSGRIVMAEDYSLQSGLTSQKLRTLNPNAKVYRYYSLIAKPRQDSDWNLENSRNDAYLQFPVSYSDLAGNNWWLRDGNGQIVPQDENSGYMVDVGKQGLKEAFLSGMLARLKDKGFDGVLLDYWWPNMISWYIVHNNLPAPANYPNDTVWFELAWQPFIEYVVLGLRNEGYKVIGNCAGEYLDANYMRQWQRSLLDGTVYENWSLDGTGNWRGAADIEQSILSFASDPLETDAVDYGLRGPGAIYHGGPLPDFEQKRLVSLAMYYVGLPQNKQLRNKRSYHYYNNSQVFWDSLWDFNIGEPAEDKVKITNKYAWSRKYTEGMVLLNYKESENITFTLDNKYTDISGNLYEGSVVLPAHTAKILKLESIIPDTTSPSIPADLTARAVSPSQINLTWSASTDNVSMAGYKVYRNGIEINTTAATSYSDTGLQANTTNSYEVSAYDAVGNESAKSSPVSVTTVATNYPPVIALIGLKTINENQLLQFTVSATDYDNDILIYSASDLPLGATFDTAMHTFSWTPSYTQSEIYQVTFTVSDGSLLTSEIITITVNDVQRSDVSSISNTSTNTSSSSSNSTSSSSNSTLTKEPAPSSSQTNSTTSPSSLTENTTSSAESSPASTSLAGAQAPEETKGGKSSSIILKIITISLSSMAMLFKFLSLIKGA